MPFTTPISYDKKVNGKLKQPSTSRAANGREGLSQPTRQATTII